MLSWNSATIKLSKLQLSTWLPSKIRKVWYQVTARLPCEQWMLQWCLITFQEWALKRFWGPAPDKPRITDLKAPPLLTSAPTFFEDSINKCQSCKSVSVHLLSSFLSLPRQWSVDSPKELTQSLCARGIYLGGIKGQTVREHWDCWCVISDRALDVSEPGLASWAQSTHLNDIPVKRQKICTQQGLGSKSAFSKSCSPYVANDEPIRSVNEAINKWDFFMWRTASTKQVMMHS